MDPSYPQDLLTHVLRGHGGVEVWDRLDALRVRLTVGGNLLAGKGISPRGRELTCTFSTRETYARLSPFPRVGQEGVFRGDSVQILEGSKVLGERKFPRGADGSVQVRHLWDNLDLLYFLGYALWNYAVTPFVFCWPGFRCEEAIPFSPAKGVVWRTLKVSYPPHFPTHCQHQVFYIDERGLIMRLDYVAEVFGRWVTGAHYCLEHRPFDDIMFATHRVVYPRMWTGQPLRLVSAMEGWIHEVIPVYSKA